MREDIERLARKYLEKDAMAGLDPQNVHRRVRLVYMDDKATYNHMSIDDVRQ